MIYRRSQKVVAGEESEYNVILFEVTDIYNILWQYISFGHQSCLIIVPPNENPDQFLSNLPGLIDTH